MAKKEKEFNFKLYAITVFIAVAAALVIICTATFSARYTAFHPDELAKNYVDTIVQTGDGYNAYKNTLVGKSTKYGDFIRKYYINPAVYRDTDFVIGGSTDGLVGYNDESFKGEKTLGDDGSLNGQLIAKMYPVYEELVSLYGKDDYDAVYNGYIEKLIAVREEIFGDKYFSDEVFFTAFEANVASYGDYLTGTEDVFDENTGAQLSYKSQGVYQKLYGEDYKLISSRVAEPYELSLEEYKMSADTEKLETYGVSTDDISDVRVLQIEVENQNGEAVADCLVTVCKIGKSWYVDNTVTDTSVLYNFYTSATE